MMYEKKLPSYQEMKKLAKNVTFLYACKLSCSECAWKDNPTDCRDLARIELEKIKMESVK